MYTLEEQGHIEAMLKKSEEKHKVSSSPSKGDFQSKRITELQESLVQEQAKCSEQDFKMSKLLKDLQDLRVKNEVLQRRVAEIPKDIPPQNLLSPEGGPRSPTNTKKQRNVGFSFAEPGASICSSESQSDAPSGSRPPSSGALKVHVSKNWRAFGSFEGGSQSPHTASSRGLGAFSPLPPDEDNEYEVEEVISEQ